MDNTVILLFIGFCLGYVLGSFWTMIRQAQAFKNILNDLGVTTEQLLKLRDKIEAEEEPQADPRGNVIEVKLEQHQGMIYAYRKDNNQFLAQGTDRDTLIQHLTQTFAQGARLIIREEDGADLVKS